MDKLIKTELVRIGEKEEKERKVLKEMTKQDRNL